MSIAYKDNGVWKTAAGTAPIDSSLSSTSENAVQNKVVKLAVDGKSNTGHTHDDRYYTKDVLENIISSDFESKTWSGLTSFYGRYIWSDGENIYYSSYTDQYVLDKSTLTWVEKTWNGLTEFDGDSLWSDGDNVYFSYDYEQHVLDKATSTWVEKTWGGELPYESDEVWTDGENIYYSSGSDHYVLDKATSTWNPKTWSGLTTFGGRYIWTDGDTIYYSNGSTHYVLDKSTSTWSAKTWNGLTTFNGYNIWTDGENVYYSYNRQHYILDKSTSTWNPKTWSRLSQFEGDNIWTDGENTYFSDDDRQYVLKSSTNVYTKGQVDNIVDGLESNFQAGVDDIYDAVVAKGSTPASKSLSDVVQGIAAISTGSGNAVAGDVLSGKTFSNNSGSQTGTMPNRGAVTQTLDASTTSYTIPEGYHDGSGAVSIVTQEKSCTPSSSAQNITSDSGKVLSKVIVAAMSLSANLLAGSFKAISQITTSLPRMVDLNGNIVKCDVGDIMIAIWGAYDSAQTSIPMTMPNGQRWSQIAIYNGFNNRDSKYYPVCIYRCTYASTAQTFIQSTSIRMALQFSGS